MGSISGLGRSPWRRTWKPAPVFLPTKSHGQISLEGCSLWGCKRVGHDLVTKQQQQLALSLLNMKCPILIAFFSFTVKTANTVSTFALCNALFVTSALFIHSSDLVVGTLAEVTSADPFLGNRLCIQD
ncbi:unnamed protein product [Rangifer tarandus platyrhynchus]|uniref:Uncharacterized protein n=1 Tax=Rangifer tarandus platyrhynchus TaxID=3082113 RepID=A0AC60A137_RANTA